MEAKFKIFPQIQNQRTHHDIHYPQILKSLSIKEIQNLVANRLTRILATRDLQHYLFIGD